MLSEKKILNETKNHNPPYKLNGRSLRVMVFNATVNDITVIAWRSVLLVEEAGVPGENQRPATSH